MNQETILITGASGCVGQYTTTWLLENSTAELLLWIRDPKKLTAIDTNNQRINLLIGDLREPNIFKEQLSNVNRVIHTATAWGDPIRANQVNITAVKNLLDLLDPKALKQIIYFSTASILDKHLRLLPEAFPYGTEYIQTKAKCLIELENHYLAEKIIAVFPTLVFGGSFNGTSKFPKSYLTEGIAEASRWIWLARWFKAYSRFHFIHAADIASICGHLATTPHPKNQCIEPTSPIKKMVLAQSPISIDQAIDSLRKWKGLHKTPKFPLQPWLINILIKILPIELSPWDRHIIKQRHFIHDPITSPEDFGHTSHAKTLEEVLAVSGLKPHKKSRKGARMIGEIK